MRQSVMLYHNVRGQESAVALVRAVWDRVCLWRLVAWRTSRGRAGQRACSMMTARAAMEKSIDRRRDVPHSGSFTRQADDAVFSGPSATQQRSDGCTLARRDAGRVSDGAM